MTPAQLTRVVPLLWLLCAMTAQAGSRSAAKQKEERGDPVLGHRIAKGLVFEGRLWLRGSDVSRKGGPGGLISLGLSDKSRTVHFEKGIIDIEKFEHQLWLLRQTATNGRNLVVSVWRNSKFEDLAGFSAAQDESLVLLSSGGNAAVLSRDGLHVLSENHHDWRVVALKGQLFWGVQISTAFPRNRNGIYVG